MCPNRQGPRLRYAPRWCSGDSDTPTRQRSSLRSSLHRGDLLALAHHYGARYPCLPTGRQGERLRPTGRSFFIGYRFDHNSSIGRSWVGVVAAAPRRCLVGFLSVLGCRPLGYFCCVFPLRPDGRTPSDAVCRSRVPARSLLARGGPRPLLRFPRSLRSRPATAVGALGERCPASRGFFFGCRRGGS